MSSFVHAYELSPLPRWPTVTTSETQSIFLDCLQVFRKTGAPAARGLLVAKKKKKKASTVFTKDSTTIASSGIEPGKQRPFGHQPIALPTELS